MNSVKWIIILNMYKLINFTKLTNNILNKNYKLLTS